MCKSNVKWICCQGFHPKGAYSAKKMPVSNVYWITAKNKKAEKAITGTGTGTGSRRAPSPPKQAPQFRQRAGSHLGRGLVQAKEVDHIRPAIANVLQGLAHGDKVDVSLAKGQVAVYAPRHILQVQVHDPVAQRVDRRHHVVVRHLGVANVQVDAQPGWPLMRAAPAREQRP